MEPLGYGTMDNASEKDRRDMVDTLTRFAVMFGYRLPVDTAEDVTTMRLGMNQEVGVRVALLLRFALAVLAHTYQKASDAEADA